jgi:nicotinate-nucleotide pyrophosphorylase (carboxylating)
MDYNSPEAQKEINRIIQNALREDVGDGDHSSLSCIPTTATGKARLLVKDEGILAGVAFAQAVFEAVDPNLKLDIRIEDGSPVKYGDEAFYVTGPSQSILKAERLALNAMQRMSAIATKTRAFVDLLKEQKHKFSILARPLLEYVY